MTHRRSIAALLLTTGLLSASPIVPGASAQEAAPPAGPANLCQELVAFVRKPEEKKQDAATPASQATAVSNPSGKSEGQPSSSGGQPQQTSGLSGPTKSDAQGPASATPAPAEAGKATLAQANAAAKNPPAPAAPAPSPKPDEALLAQIDAATAANDQVACRAAARTLRVAGVIMPPPLLALSALDPKFHTAVRP